MKKMVSLSSSHYLEIAENEAFLSQFCASDYSGDLLHNLSRLYADECFCDVEIMVSPERLIRAHRCVLSAASPYFHAMLTGGLRESRSDVIDMRAVGAPHIIEKLVTFIYTGHNYNQFCFLSKFICVYINIDLTALW